MTNTKTTTTHELSKTDRDSDIKTIHIFAPAGSTVEITTVKGQAEDERHHSEGWGHERSTRTLSTAAARAEYKALTARGFTRYGW